VTRRAPAVRPDPTLHPRSREPLVSADIAVVTPIFGGGAIPGLAEPALPIRGASIRGHLRFWWRACHASRYQTPADLFRAESQIWGGQTDVAPSAVDLSVDILDAGEPRPYAYFERRRGPLPYVLFPFRTQRPQAVAMEGVRFRLELFVAPHVDSVAALEIAREVQDAIWAWTTFGGLGARTRRGCGAVSYPGLPKPAPELLSSWFVDQAAEHVSASSSTDPPRLPVLHGARCLVYSGAPSAPYAAWERAIELLRAFRRPRPNEHRVWPDAASIRQALDPNDRSPTTESRYPRADLGLPIVFQRMMTPDPVLVADGGRGRRMASPVIVRPLVLSDGTAVPLILVMQAPHVSETGARLVWDQPRAPRNVRVSRDQLASRARDEFVDYVTRRADWSEVRLQARTASAG
jgi:CRISPR-associated protein Cmr1